MNTVSLEFGNDLEDQDDPVTSTWTDNDVRFLKNPKNIQRLEQFKYQNIPEMNIHFIVEDLHHSNKWWDRADCLEPDPKKITFVIRNNISQNRIMITPWMLAHRLFHSTMKFTGGMISDDLTEAYGFKNKIIGWFTKPGKHDEHAPRWLLEDELLMGHLVNNTLTMASARAGMIGNWFDVSAELFAQYVVNGRVRFNPVPETVRVAYTAHYERKIVNTREMKTCIDHRLLEERVNDQLSDAARAMIGEVFCL